MRGRKAIVFIAVYFLAGCEEGGPKFCAPPDLIDLIKSFSASGSVSISQLQDVSGINFVPPEEGGSFMAKNGDWIMENEKIRVIIQQASRQISPAPYGGNLIDADVKGDDVWNDVMGEISTFLGISYTMDAEHFEVLRDGSDGVGVMRVSGKTTILDYINVESAVYSIASSFLKLELPWDLNKGIPFYVSNYYVLRAGDSHLKLYTAMCNTSGKRAITTLGDIIDSGGTVAYFNVDQIVDGIPGFGYTDDPISDIQPARMVGFIGRGSGYAIIPQDKAWNIILSGVAVIQYGTENGLDFLLKAITGGVDEDKPPAGYFAVGGKKSIWYGRDVIIFDSFSSMMEEYYRLKSLETGKISGSVRLGNTGVESAKVAFINSEGKLEVLFETDKDGNYSGLIAPGTYEVYADVMGWPSPPSQTITINKGDEQIVNFLMSEPAFLSFKVEGVDYDTGPAPITQPAKVSLRCVGSCPRTEKRYFYDTLYDKFPSGYQVQAFVDHRGKVSVMAKRGVWMEDELPVPPGTYDVFISRGMEFDLYSERITVSAGEHRIISCRIDRVVDTRGYISADLHVHSVNSPDAPVPLIDRILTFMGEGVDVLVSTDHDFITDYRPLIEKIGASLYLTSFPGEELTTFDVGHFNAYPLRVSESEYQNGALDWAGGRGPNLTPQEIFEGLKSMGEIENPVVQVNHPRSIMMGYFTAIQLDTDTLKTHADPTKFRMDVKKLEMKEDDTGLFSNIFDAFEIYNSYGVEITQTLNDYFTFLNIGLKKAAVAVSDTHHWYISEAGVPRSFIYVGEGKDTPQSIDGETFARAIQDMKVVGTNGPFIHSYLQDGQKIYRMGELAPFSNNLKLIIEIRMPEWMSVDTLEIFSNTPNTASRNGRPVDKYPQPLLLVRISPSDFVVSNKQKTYTYTYPITASTDAWYVVVVRDDPDFGENYPMVPVLAKGGELPFAFTNAFFVDRDGNGTFDPPGATLGEAQSSIKRSEIQEERLINEEELKEILKKLGELNCENH